MTSLSDIRETFTRFFGENGHEIVPSSPLVPRNDPTLLFTNAGMVQFKNVFTGAETRPYGRAATVQKCVRAGGKHNDLDNVGYTARHHTFFEMLGNFSFGDYFKEEAIKLAWDLVTREFQLAKDRLIVTIHPSDDQARGLWRRISGIDDRRIIGHESNLWAMGPVGPCGYCSEIFFDQGDKVQGGPPGSPDEDGDRFLEFWNLVFMQFEQVDEKTRIDLPRPSIDTGMGLERITAILQRVTSNYDTDLFRTLIDISAQASGTHAQGTHAASHRVIADHVRSAAFLIADGILPSNEGRGYVLRRIMRRAMRHAHILGAKDPLLHRVAPTLVALMGKAYPELMRAEPLILETLKLEETRFRQMLERGLRLLEDETAKVSGDVLPGAVAFRLYDTFGFPLDLTQDALRARGMSVDIAGFDEAMERQRAEARKAWSGSGEMATEQVWFAIRERAGATEFLGYGTEAAEGIIVAIVRDGVNVSTLASGESGQIITNQTPFYAESGGQVGDQGALITRTGAEAAVTDTLKRAGDLHVHQVTVNRGTLSLGDAADLRVDGALRRATRANHSATHLLHEALRRVLGPHVTQKGSLVAPDRLRFDFSHTKAVNEDEVERIEAIVNGMIRANDLVDTTLMTPGAAIAAGAMALFGEKYGDEVRVLRMGEEVGGKPFSVELCGGTHVRRTGDIGLFKVTGEGAVAAGVRRLEALTGEGALSYLNVRDKQLRSTAAALKSQALEVHERVNALVEDRRKLERELAETKRSLAMGGTTPADSPAQAELVAGVRVMARVVSGVDAKDLRPMIDAAKQQIGSGIVVFGTESGGKANIAVGVTDDLKEQISAVDLVRAGVEILGGKGGGGRSDLAQAGGPHPEKLHAAVDAIKAAIALAPSLPAAR